MGLEFKLNSYDGRKKIEDPPSMKERNKMKAYDYVVTPPKQKAPDTTIVWMPNDGVYMEWIWRCCVGKENIKREGEHDYRK
ncbi:hypothetical protein VNO77_00225 [Canavalia gladiata]|uniref:Uncharacterized protein n=1 Tax=Canavalia gladiata TaxID=3824 RepID=A0AAN9MVF4_CANGL